MCIPGQDDDDDEEPTTSAPTTSAQKEEALKAAYEAQPVQKRRRYKKKVSKISFGGGLMRLILTRVVVKQEICGHACSLLSPKKIRISIRFHSEGYFFLFWIL